MNYKYRVSYKNQQFLGNTPESLEKALVKAFKISEAEANKIVSRLIRESIPVVKDQMFKSSVGKKALSFREAVNGAKAVLKASLGIGVEQSVINQRAIKCSACPKISTVTNCKSCGWGSKFQKWMKSMISIFRSNFTVPNGLDDKYCSVCDCSIAAMLPAQLSDFKNESDAKKEERKEVNCWILPE